MNDEHKSALNNAEENVKRFQKTTLQNILEKLERSNSERASKMSLDPNENLTYVNLPQFDGRKPLFPRVEREKLRNPDFLHPFKERSVKALTTCLEGLGLASSNTSQGDFKPTRFGIEQQITNERKLHSRGLLEHEVYNDSRSENSRSSVTSRPSRMSRKEETDEESLNQLQDRRVEEVLKTRFSTQKTRLMASNVENSSDEE